MYENIGGVKIGEYKGYPVVEIIRKYCDDYGLSLRCRDTIIVQGMYVTMHGYYIGNMGNGLEINDEMFNAAVADNKVLKTVTEVEPKEKDLPLIKESTDYLCAEDILNNVWTK